MEKIRNWKQDFYTIWAGQAVSLITSGVLQMAIIWHLTNTTGSAMVLSMATLVGFLPQAVLGSAIGVLVDRWNRKMVMIGKQTYNFSLLHIDGNAIGNSSFTITLHQTLCSENQFFATIRLLLRVGSAGT